MLKSQFRLDWKLINPALIILTLSFLILGSIDSSALVSQLIFFLISTIVFYFFSKVNYQDHQYLLSIYLVVSYFLLILPFVFGVVTRGSVRWIQVGSLTLQPSEIIKPFIILTFASYLGRPKLQKNIKTLLSYLSLLVLPAILILKQPDLGSTLVIASTWLGIFFAAKFPKSIIFFSLLLGLIISPLTWSLLQPYQKSRITSFINPYSDPKGSGYHVIQSTIAVGSGGFLGKGLGYGTQSQLNFLPERHTDFVFASLSEEMGLLGSATLILAYFYLLKHLLYIASHAPDEFSYLTTIGIFSMLLFQGTVNVGMNLGVLPVTGITLPLVSAGGSSLLATMISLALAHNISLQIPKIKGLEIK